MRIRSVVKTSKMGFTLTELLVVICVVSMLALIIMTSLGSAGEGNLKTSCMNNLREIGASLNAYANDFEGYYPPAYRGTNPRAHVRYRNRMEWSRDNGFYSLKKGMYVTNPDIFSCPANPREINVAFIDGRWVRKSDPSAVPPTYSTTYGYYAGGVHALDTGTVHNNWYAEANLNYSFVGDFTDVWYKVAVRNTDAGVRVLLGDNTIHPQGSAYPETTNHTEGAHFAYIDGSARWSSSDEWRAYHAFPRVPGETYHSSLYILPPDKTTSAEQK